MSKVMLGIICGIVFGVVSVATMIPLKLDDKKMAMAGAFANRFAIGFVIGATDLPMTGWLNGLLFGLLQSARRHHYKVVGPYYGSWGNWRRCNRLSCQRMGAIIRQGVCSKGQANNGLQPTLLRYAPQRG